MPCGMYRCLACDSKREDVRLSGKLWAGEEVVVMVVIKVVKEAHPFRRCSQSATLVTTAPCDTWHPDTSAVARRYRSEWANAWTKSSEGQMTDVSKSTSDRWARLGDQFARHAQSKALKDAGLRAGIELPTGGSTRFDLRLGVVLLQMLYPQQGVPQRALRLAKVRGQMLEELTVVRQRIWRRAGAIGDGLGGEGGEGGDRRSGGRVAQRVIRVVALADVGVESQLEGAERG
ncbi:hypothetical protein FGB62_302g00 [Gracilaria domingensis]|nr:hypothetical protein FGB62_302g00 [Gracilaria domingensis]